MYPWSPFPFIRYSIALIIGILLSQQVLFPVNALFLSLSSFVLVSIVWILNSFPKTFISLRVIGGLAILISFVVAGFFVSELKKQKGKHGHYTTHQETQAFQAVVISDNSERKDYQRYEVEIQKVFIGNQALPAHGKFFLYVRKEEAKTIYKYGDVLSVVAGYHPIGAPGNPEEFDYQSYLEKQNIFCHAFASESDIVHLGNHPPSKLLSLAYAIRAKSKNIIFEFIPEPREQAILTALLLGIKDHLDNETKAAYSSAGAMHVLAVSGLHVGIIYYLINILFGFIKKKKAGKLTFIFLAVNLIWAYALITGFSPSVLRAAVMFSVILISQTLSKSANIYNSLGIAAFVLLLYDPFLIYSVGFQLSFAAVFGIVFLQPKLVRLLNPYGIVLSYLWAITCVSVSAQLATFPLTVYYFHQFPTYFLVSNIVVIPAAVIILVGGIVLILGSIIHVAIGQAIGYVLFWVIWSVNQAVGFLTLLPLPIIDWLYFDIYETVLVYAIILLFSLAFNYYLKNAVFLGLTAFTILTVWMNFKIYHQSLQKRIIFYEIKDHIAIDLVVGNSATLLVDRMDSTENEVFGFQVNPFRLANGLPEMNGSYQEMDKSDLVIEHDFGYMLKWHDVSVLILKPEREYQVDSLIRLDIVYLNDTKNITFDNISAETIILGSNIKYGSLNWVKVRLDKINRKSHSLVENGFYEVRL